MWSGQSRDNHYWHFVWVTIIFFSVWTSTFTFFTFSICSDLIIVLTKRTYSLYTSLFFYVTVPASIESFGEKNASCEGLPLELTCNVRGNPAPLVTLVNKTDGRVLLSTTNISLTYVINELDRTHVGTYVCKANNSVNQNVQKEFRIERVYGKCFSKSGLMTWRISDCLMGFPYFLSWCS